MFKQIVVRIAHELEQTLTLLVNDLVFGKKARKGRRIAAYKAPRTRTPRTAPRTAYTRAMTPRMMVVHIHEGAIVHF